jgi:hypothetical protein
MKTLRVSLTIILIIYSIPTLLSGLDIYKGTEPDLSSEWKIIGIFFVLAVIYSIFNLLEIIRERKLHF